MKKKRGRPPKAPGQSMSERIEFRAKPDEKHNYEQSAQLDGVEVAEWIRRTLNAAAKRRLNREK